MPLKKIMTGERSDLLAAEGLLYQDWDAITACQRECMARVGNTVQLEQEAYLTQHPEVKAMLEIFISKMVRSGKRKGILKEAAEHFTRPVQLLDFEIRRHLRLSPEEAYIKHDQPPFYYNDEHLEIDLRDIIMEHFLMEPLRLPTPVIKTPDTMSSSFISIITSDTTLPTPALRADEKADEPPDGKWSSSPMDTSNTRGITNATPALKKRPVFKAIPKCENK